MDGSPAIDPRLAPLVQFMEEGIPFNRYLGLKVERLGNGHCVLRIPFREQLIGDPFRPALHGGVTSMLVDAAGGSACFSMLGSYRDRVSTIDLRVDYLRPGPSADLLCEARVLRLGNKVAVCRMEVFSGTVPAPGTPEREQAVATGQGVYNVLRRNDKDSGPA